MENATDALKIAFAVFVFVMALTLTISVFAQIRQASDTILRVSDKTNYYEYVEGTTTDNGERIVGIETIIPTLYRYVNESVKIIIKDKSGNYIQIFDITIENDINKYKNSGDSEKVKIYNSYQYSFSELEGNKELTPWTAGDVHKTVIYRRERIKLFLSGIEGTINGTTLKYKDGFLGKYGSNKFIESFQEEDTEEDDELTGGRLSTSQITIIYTEY